jgi:hypothetical protein
MNNHHQNYHDDEINLMSLFSVVWRGKIYIILITIVSVFIASQHLHSTTRKYSVEYNLKPVGETKVTPNFSGLGGFASIAGIELPSSSDNDFNMFRKLITSTDVSKIIFNNKKIIKEIFKSEWNESLNIYSKPSKSKIQIMINKAKRLLTGSKELDYMPPNPRRLAIFISKSIDIEKDKDTGFLIFSTETSNPELMLSLIIEATKASDSIMRQRYINFSTEPLAFYKEKIRTARSREHREALAELIGKEEQKLMFASRGKYFIAEPYIESTVSLQPTSPRPKIVLLFSLIFGFFTGCCIILLRDRLVKDLK